MRVPISSLGTLTLSIQWDNSWDDSVFIEMKKQSPLLDLIASCCGAHKIPGWDLMVPYGYEFRSKQNLEHFCFVARIACSEENPYYYTQV